MKRVCARCKGSILKHHRWHNVHRVVAFLGITLWRWTEIEHRDCKHPEMGSGKAAGSLDHPMRFSPEKFRRENLTIPETPAQELARLD